MSIIAEPIDLRAVMDKAWDEFIRTHTAKIGDLTFVLITDSGLPPGTMVMRSSLSEVRVTGLSE
jgi:hypothetical protein